MNRRVDILKIQGRGSVILSVVAVSLKKKVSSEFPLKVSSRDLRRGQETWCRLSWKTASLEESRYPTSFRPKIRFEGPAPCSRSLRGPRRRASTLARPQRSRPALASSRLGPEVNWPRGAGMDVPEPLAQIRRLYQIQHGARDGCGSTPRDFAKEASRPDAASRIRAACASGSQ
jgi:hypothetical protein